MNRLINRIGFLLRIKYYTQVTGSLRKTWFRIWGMSVGRKTTLPKIAVSWPHQVAIGNNCQLENNIQFKFDGIWQKGPSILIGNAVFIGTNCEFNIRKGITIGDHANIASGCHFVDHDHGTSGYDLVGAQNGIEKKITIGVDVWLGCNVIVLKGVDIGSGAIVGAGAVVTKSIPRNEIWAGIPARRIGARVFKNDELPIGI
jgi:acetyltransferase-like isoleucine patch superfamily enzyme